MLSRVMLFFLIFSSLLGIQPIHQATNRGTHIKNEESLDTPDKIVEKDETELALQHPHKALKHADVQTQVTITSRPSDPTTMMMLDVHMNISTKITSSTTL